MADSIREQVIKNLVAAIKTVKTANGYINNIPDANVERGKTTPVDYSQVPAVFLFESDEEIIDREYGSSVRAEHELMVDLEIWQKNENDLLPEAINQIEAEVIKAIMADQTLGGLAITVEKKGSTAFFIEGEKVLGGRIMTIGIRYICREIDPFSQ